MTKLKEIHIVLHTHTDIGFTHDQPIVWDLHGRFIEEALDLIEAEAAAGIPEHAAFKWTCEAWLPVWHWWQQTTSRNRERFAKWERAQRIEVTGLPLHLAPLYDVALHARIQDRMQTFSAATGCRIRSAMNCDVNGQHWFLADLLLDAGITGYSTAINTHFGHCPLQRPALFHWLTPSGRQLPCYNGMVYGFANRFLDPQGTKQDEFNEKLLPALSRHLHQVGWNLPVFMIQGVHSFGDNGSVPRGFSQSVQHWNAAHPDGPRLRISTMAQWWQAVEPYLNAIPTYAGDWTDSWNFGCGSAARELAVVKRAQTRLHVADTLRALLPFNDARLATSNDRYRDAADLALIHWTEHTWGADCGVGEPYSEDTDSLWNHKASTAYHVRSFANLLRRDGLAALAAAIRTKPAPADGASYQADDASYQFVVFNPLPFKRTVAGMLPSTISPHPRGGLSLAGVDRFEIIEADSGETVYQGKITAGFPAARDEGFSVPGNFVGADVLYLDFHDFGRAGQYRIHVPGMGNSAIITIGEQTWSTAFRTAMHGFLSHRSGIELGPPFSQYLRPRNMHPDDGFRVFAIPYTLLEGEFEIVAHAIRQKLASGTDPGTWETVPNAWGGYMDAGDWDRRVQHLAASRDLIELFTLNPDFFADFAMALPPEEATDAIPDLLNEVIWNVGFYRRLQLPDGGVRGGIESTEHPRPGEASWEESLVIAAFAPDPMSTYSYAATAAQLAVALRPYDATDAEAFAESALRAWQWAEANTAAVLDAAQQRRDALPDGVRGRFNRQRAETTIQRLRFVAAGELFALTGEAEFHDVFKQMITGAGDDHDEMGTYFRYAELPDDKTCPDVRATARGRLLAAAERALEFGSNNAFGLHNQAPTLPMMGYVGFYSVPEMVTGPVLPRAYRLTGDNRFLRGALKAAHFSAGANPLSRTFTTGVGFDYPRNPLHIDSRVTGQKAPDGITIYGPMDAGADFTFNDWAHRWHLNDMVPNSRTWPATSWHVDLFRWPAMSEYTIHQTFRPVAYYWGFLAARISDSFTPDTK